MSFKTIRAKEEFERAGAYYVRIQAMAKKYGITLREEFDENDGAKCHYIVAFGTVIFVKFLSESNAVFFSHSLYAHIVCACAFKFFFGSDCLE